MCRLKLPAVLFSWLVCDVQQSYKVWTQLEKYLSKKKKKGSSFWQWDNLHVQLRFFFLYHQVMVFTILKILPQPVSQLVWKCKNNNNNNGHIIYTHIKKNKKNK